MDCAAWFGSTNGLFFLLGVMFVLGVGAGLGIAPHLPHRLRRFLGI